MRVNRAVTWEGFFNARDLGGLPTQSGRTTSCGAYIRSADLRFVTDDGWSSARDAGLRTIIDLRNDDEIRPVQGRTPSATAGSAQFAATPAGAVAPPGIDRVEVPLDDITDSEFWERLNRDQLNGSPLYYPLFLEHKAERCAAVVTALAQAAPGGVLFHCGAGRDRTGLISLLLLALVDVERQAIATDYDLSTIALPPLFAAMGTEDQGPVIQVILADLCTTTHDAVLTTLAGFDAEDYLLHSGVSRADIHAIRHRLLG